MERAGHLLVGLFITRPAILAGRVLRIATRRAQSHVTQPEDVREILVILVQALGDVIVSSAYLKSLKKTFPNSRVTLVVDKKFLRYASRCPHVDEVLGFDESASKYRRVLFGPVASFVFAQKNLRSRCYDLVLNSRWDVDSRHAAFLGLFSKSVRHVGYAVGCNPRKRIINGGLDSAFTDVYTTETVVHESERGTDLLKFLGYPVEIYKSEMWMDTSDVEYAATQLEGLGEDIVALGIGASEAKRRWPISRYLALAEAILRVCPDARFLIVGDREDRRRAEESLTSLGNRILNFAGICQITQSAALLRRCRLYIGNDSGPMHMAAAVSTPVVEISCHPLSGSPQHANAPERYYPLISPHRIVRPPTFSTPCAYACSAKSPHCILAVGVERVLEAATELLKATDRAFTRQQ